MASIFQLSNFAVLPFWALMILVPRWRWTARIVKSPFIGIAPAALYIALVLPRLGAIWPAVSRPTPSGIALLLGSSTGATIAWAHFLAFDLLVGRWIYLDSKDRRISAWLMAPLLFLTFMLGPLGFVLYLVVRSMVPSPGSNTNAMKDLQFHETEKRSFVGSSSITNRLRALPKLISSAFEIDGPLTILGSMMLLVFLATVVGLFVDHRVITGVPAWLKPAKFAISVSVYCFTFVWLLGFVEGHPRLVRMAANVTVVSIVVEMAVIIAQAARGTTSHFNMATPLNSFLWMTMGLFITFVWSMNLLLAVLLIWQRLADRAFAWSLRLGVLISSVGMAVAFLMARPTPEQVAAFANHVPRTVGAHSVGVADGGPGLPVLGWSTVGGDLRVAHFLGLHGLQVLPLLGWFLTRRGSRNHFLSGNQRLTLVWSAGVTYFGLVLLLAWQALRGQSVIHPDKRTIAAALVLVSTAALSILITLGRALSSNRRGSGLQSNGIVEEAFLRSSE